MAQQTANWRFAGYVPDQFDRCRIEADWYSDGLVFLGREDRLEFDIALQNLAAGSVDAAYGGTELPVRVGRNVLLEKVYKAAIALQQSQHLHCPVERFRARLVAADLWCARSRLCWGCKRCDLCLRIPQCLQYVLRDLSLKQ